VRILITSIVDLERVPHNRIHEFVRFLSQEHEITVLSIRDWWRSEHPDVDVYRTHFEESLRNIEVVHLTNQRIRPFVQEVTSVAHTGTILDRIDTRFDVHLNYSTLVCGFATTRKMRKQGVGTVYDIADDLPEMIGMHPQIPSPLRPFGRILARLVYQKNVEMSAKITLTTPALKESCSIPDEKYEILPNGVDTLLFRNHPCKDLKEDLYGREAFVIGYVGVLREWVDLEPIFAAVRQLAVDYPMIKILILGEEGGLTKPKELASAYALSDRVVFTGTVPYLEIPRFISCMDVGIIPFRSNRITIGALPLKLFEYMACEKPVISTPLPAIEDAMEDSVIYASGEEELAAAIATLYENPSRQKELGQAGRRFVEHNYSWEVIATRLEQILQEVAESEHTPMYE
jgi:glycosyltransferase involved in cell wall biosynthesis